MPLINFPEQPHNNWFLKPINADTIKHLVDDKVADKEPNEKKAHPESLDGKIRPFGKRYRYKPLSKYRGIIGKHPCRAGTTYVGVEVELEGVSYERIPEGTWTPKEDNSLKDRGMEFITIPIPFKFLEIELQRLFASLISYNTSSRCSIHVHLNVRDFSIEELKSFIILYMIFEKTLYKFSGNRWNSNFCVPLYSYINTVKRFMENSNEIVGIHEKWFKYFGLNLSPVFGGESSKLGTIEFRHLCGTDNIHWIIEWINLIVSLKITAKKLTLEKIFKSLAEMNTDSSYYELAKETFKEFSNYITEQPDFKEDVENCITRVKYLWFSNKNVAGSVEIPMFEKGNICVD